VCLLIRVVGATIPDRIGHARAVSIALILMSLGLAMLFVFPYPLGVFLRGADVPERWRLKTAQELGFSETAFVDEDGPDGQAVRIFTPS
jgi:hypothetical protein